MKYGLFLALLLGFAGCQDADKEISKTQQDLERLIEKAGKHFETVTSNPGQVTNAAQAEVEKIFVFEYKVFPLSPDRSAKTAESALNQLGRERWDCFQVSEMEEGLSAFCKRSPKSYLRYIPRIIP